MKQKLFIIFLLFCCTLQAREFTEYRVEIRGDLPQDVLQRIESHSQLYTLSKRPPATSAGLKRRAEGDIPNIVRALHSFAYYNARVDISYQFKESPPLVIVKVITGPIYPFEKIEVAAMEGSSEPFFIQDFIETLNRDYKGKAATPAAAIEIEERLRSYMQCSGYPFPTVAPKSSIADQATQTVSLSLYLDSGPLAFFGETAILGNRTVRQDFFCKHIAWSKGQLYCPNKVEKTLQALELSQLFSSVTITPDKPPLEDGRLPMTIEVHESRQRSIGVGVNYASQRGVGFSGEWEHRNFRGMGDTLSLRTNLWYDEQFAKLAYLQKDLFCNKQDLLWLGELYREKTEGYTTRSISASATFSRPVSPRAQISYGLKFTYLHDTDVHDKKIHQDQKHDSQRFHLIKVPLSYRYNCTDDLLDPSKGWRMRLKMEPSCQVSDTPFLYSINVLRASRYWKISKKPFLVFAAATTWGAITGPGKTTLPRSELFDAGTDTLLRGYRYKSVSPLDNDYDPTGGRAMLISTAELRWRMNDEIGWVAFYDFGNVYSEVLPDFRKKILQSAGIGFRYYTPVGPVRLDLAFPLTPRKHVDKSRYQAYLSIGQTF